jgi:hypothetical protein
MLLAATAGVAAGLVHVLSGPDHMAAVAPLAIANSPASAAASSRGWYAGLQWGIGHSAGVLAIGLLLLVLREQFPIERISTYSERAVGVALVMVGAWGLWRASRMGRPNGTHAHAAAGASFAMGALHGLAGSSHLFGVLPALAFGLRSDAASYLVGFGVGAVCGMTAFAAAIGRVSSRFEQQSARASRGFLYGCSVAAVIVGGVWLLK